MPIELRKTLLSVETTFIEGGRGAAVPLRLIAALAVVRNPWAGRRPHHRIGDRYQDLKDLGHDVDNPAAV